MDEQRNCFLEIASTLGKHAVKTVEMKTKNSEYYMNLADKAAGGVDQIDSNFETNSNWG